MSKHSSTCGDDRKRQSTELREAAARIRPTREVVIVPDDGLGPVGLLPGCPGATLLGVVTGGCAEGPVAGTAQKNKILVHPASGHLHD